MNRLRAQLSRWKPSTWALALANAVLGVAAIVIVMDGTRTKALLATSPLATTDTPTPSLSPERRNDLALIQDRSLFHPARRYWSPEAPNTRPTAPPPPQYQLAGTFMAPGKRATAVLRGASGSASKSVHLNEDLEGWTVQIIELGRVVLGFADQHVELTRGTGAQAAALSPAGAVGPQGVVGQSAAGGSAIQGTPATTATATHAAAGGIRVLGTAGVAHVTAGSQAIPAGRPVVRRREL